MKKTKIAGQWVEMYTSIEDLPYKRFVQFNTYVAIDAGTGSSLEDFDQRMSRVYSKQALAKQSLADGGTSAAERYIKEAIQELQNVRQSYQFVMQSLSPKMLSFACLVHSINGTICSDLSADGLQRVVDKLSNEKQSTLSRLFESVKKKIHAEVQQAEGRPVAAQEISYYKLLKDQIRALAESILSGKDNTQEVESIEHQLVSYGKAPPLFGQQAIEKTMRTNYHNLSLSLARNFNKNIDRMTTSAVIAAVAILKQMESNKPKSKS